MIIVCWSVSLSLGNKAAMLCWRQTAECLAPDRQLDRRAEGQRSQIIKRSDTDKGFKVLPQRWIVERTLAWLNRNRRLVKDFEKTIASATAWLFIVSAQLYARRITRT